MSYAYCSYPGVVNDSSYDSGALHEAFQYLSKVLSLANKPQRWGGDPRRELTEAWLWELLRKQAELNEALSRELEELKAAVRINR